MKIVGNDKYIEVLDTNKSPITKFYGKDIEKTAKHFFGITTIHGIVVEIGRPDKDIRRGRYHVKIEGHPYLIFTNNEKDSYLGKYYDERKKIAARIKQKISIVDGKILSAELLDFSGYEKGSFIDHLKSINNEKLIKIVNK